MAIACGCAGDVGDNSEQCRHLRDRAGDAGGLGNYALNYASADLTVTQRTITVTADAKSRAYGDANPALTYQVGGSGLVNGDTRSGSRATSATTASNVGTYAIAQGTLATAGTTRLTMRAPTCSSPSGDHGDGGREEPRLWRHKSGVDLSGGGSGFANGDTLSGALATPATTASNVGTYGINPRDAGGFEQLRDELREQR